jgi:hypothetical protein
LSGVLEKCYIRWTIGRGIAINTRTGRLAWKKKWRNDEKLVETMKENTYL